MQPLTRETGVESRKAEKRIAPKPGRYRVIDPTKLDPRIVYKTTAYDAFKDVVGNRELNRLTISRLYEAMNEQRLIAPILVNERLEVIDGQHRLHVARKLNAPVFFIVRPGYGHKEIMLYNAMSRNWQQGDFLHLHVKQEIPDYVYLDAYAKSYDLTTSVAIALLTKMLNPHSHGNPRKTVASTNGKTVRITAKGFAEGLFQVTIPREEAELTAQRLNEVKAALLDVVVDAKDFVHTTAFAMGYNNLQTSPLYDHVRMMNQLKAGSGHMRKPLNELHDTVRHYDAFAVKLQKIYNLHQRKDIFMYTPLAKPYYLNHKNS